MSNLVVKQKLSYTLSGTSVSTPFSLLGFQPDPIQYIGVLLKTSNTYTLRIRDMSGNLITEKSGTGSGNYEIVTLGGNLNLTCPNIYLFEGESISSISVYELNLATLCLCAS
jgi:hypothetical protein